MITVYAYDCGSVSESLFREMLSRVGGGRRAKAERYLKREDAVRSVCGELIVRTLFTQEYGGTPVFAANAYGKPSVAGCPDFHYNVSHSGKWVVCAVAGSEIGVDVEKAKKANLAIAKRFFAAEEIAALNSRPENEKCGYFYKLWTAKEAYIKCVGRGLSIPLESFSVTGGRVTADGNQTGYIIRHYDIGSDYCLAACSEDAGEAELVRLENILQG